MLSPADQTLFDEGAANVQNFSWETSADVDGDPISYALYVTDGEIMDTSYTGATNSIDVNIEDLARDVWLDWSVVAHDGWGYTVSLDTFAVRVSSLVDIQSTPQYPHRFVVRQNYPNPFNPSTQIVYSLPQSDDVVITIRDISGRPIFQSTLVAQGPGWKTFSWNGTMTNGEHVSTGIYLCQIQSGNSAQTVKMVYLK